MVAKRRYHSQTPNNRKRPRRRRIRLFPQSETMTRIYQKYTSDPPYAMANQKLASVRIEKGG